jgi:hypothetical protein
MQTLCVQHGSVFSIPACSMCTFAVIKIDNISNLIVGLKRHLVIDGVELENYTVLQLRKLCLFCTQYCFLVHTNNKPIADTT